jgi:hypothetical protein
MAEVICAGWADNQGSHPCGNVLGQTSGKRVSHGMCIDCFVSQLKHLRMSDQSTWAESVSVTSENSAL